jgi:hypothetical protein
MRRAAAFCLALAAAPALAASAPVMPAPFRGNWVLAGGNCTDGLQMEGVLSIQPRRIMYGEIQMQLTAVRRVSAVRIGVDTRNTAEAADLAPWTTTTMLTLSQRGQRLTFDKTRNNGRLLAERSPESYKRCP